MQCVAACMVSRNTGGSLRRGSPHHDARGPVKTSMCGGGKEDSNDSTGTHIHTHIMYIYIYMYIDIYDIYIE